MSLNIFFTKHKSENIGSFGKVSFLVTFFEEMGADFENQTFEVSKEDVEILLSRCKQVLKKHSLAKELLPITDCFFENTKYDETYYNDVRAVRDYIINILLPHFDSLQDGETINLEISY